MIIPSEQVGPLATYLAAVVLAVLMMGYELYLGIGALAMTTLTGETFTYRLGMFGLLIPLVICFVGALGVSWKFFRRKQLGQAILTVWLVPGGLLIFVFLAAFIWQFSRLLGNVVLLSFPWLSAWYLFKKGRL